MKVKSKFSKIAKIVWDSICFASVLSLVRIYLFRENPTIYLLLQGIVGGILVTIFEPILTKRILSKFKNTSIK